MEASLLYSVVRVEVAVNVTLTSLEDAGVDHEDVWGKCPSGGKARAKICACVSCEQTGGQCSWQS